MLPPSSGLFVYIYSFFPRLGSTGFVFVARVTLYSIAQDPYCLSELGTCSSRLSFCFEIITVYGIFSARVFTTIIDGASLLPFNSVRLETNVLKTRSHIPHLVGTSKLPVKRKVKFSVHPHLVSQDVRSVLLQATSRNCLLCMEKLNSAHKSHLGR